MVSLHPNTKFFWSFNKVLTDALADQKISESEAKKLSEIIEEIDNNTETRAGATENLNGLMDIAQKIDPKLFQTGEMFETSQALNIFAAAIEEMSEGIATVTNSLGIQLGNNSVPRTTIRFQKIPTPDGSVVTVRYPLTEEGKGKLRNTFAASPTLPNDLEVIIAPSFMAKPSYPGEPDFWNEFRDVCDWRDHRLNGTPATEIYENIPSVFEGDSIETIAQKVRADYPTDFGEFLTKKFFAEGAKVDEVLFPHDSLNDFTDFVNVTAFDGFASAEVTESCFAAKWHYGRPRAEEVAWAIHKGWLKAPQDIKERVAAMNLEHPTEFTAFIEGREGCPPHPSYPAMHSAISVTSFVKSILFDLTEEQLAEARHQDFMVAFGRSLAGVHYESDNIAGLMLGQEVMSYGLVRYFEQKFGRGSSQVKYLKAKIEKSRYDWTQHPRPNTSSSDRAMAFESTWQEDVAEQPAVDRNVA